MEALLGTPELVGKTGATTLAATLEGKDYVLLYFSASWCGPCKAFTPKLAEFYAKHKEEKKFEVIFLSGDRDEASFKAYYNSHPWTALFNPATYQRLMKHFKVQGIPTLIALDAKTGEAITSDGRMGVMADPAAEAFPWRPSLQTSLFTKNVLNKAGSTDALDDIVAKNDYVFLYFSAAWCGPCKAFTPKLAEFYAKHKEEKKFEIIFISLDRDEAGFKAYYATHPWLAIAAGQAAQIAASSFKVQGIPSLQLYDTKAQRIICADAVSEVASDPAAEAFPWPASMVSFIGGAKEITTKSGTTTIEAATEGKAYTLLYFSASWCPPCKKFTPKLGEFYTKNKDTLSFEVVFMSLDRDEKSFNEYYASQADWLAIYGAPAQKAAGKIGLEGIPTLVVIDNKTNEVVTTDGVEGLMGAPSEFPWV